MRSSALALGFIREPEGEFSRPRDVPSHGFVQVNTSLRGGQRYHSCCSEFFILEYSWQHSEA